MSESFTLLNKGSGSFSMLNKSMQLAMVSKNESFSFLGSNRGAKGDRGESGTGVAELEPRIEALENEDHILFNTLTPLP